MHADMGVGCFAGKGVICCCVCADKSVKCFCRVCVQTRVCGVFGVCVSKQRCVFVFCVCVQTWV